MTRAKNSGCNMHMSKRSPSRAKRCAPSGHCVRSARLSRTGFLPQGSRALREIPFIMTRMQNVYGRFSFPSEFSHESYLYIFYNQYSCLTMADNPFGHAAHEKPLKTSSSMASDNDQVGVLLLYRVHDGLIRLADDR